MTLRRDLRFAGQALLGDFPGLNELCSEVATGLHQEGTRAHRHVTHLQVEDVRCRAQLPLLLWLALSRAGVDQRVEGVLHNRFGQAARCVVRACRAPVAALCDINGTRGDDHGVVERVRAQQTGKGQYTLK